MGAESTRGTHRRALLVNGFYVGNSFSVIAAPRKIKFYAYLPISRWFDSGSEYLRSMKAYHEKEMLLDSRSLPRFT